MYASHDTPESLLIDREEKEASAKAVDHILNELEGGDRDLFLSILSGATDEEISEVTGRHLPYQQKLRSNLLAKLRRLIKC